MPQISLELITAQNWQYYCESILPQQRTGSGGHEGAGSIEEDLAANSFEHGRGTLTPASG